MGNTKIRKILVGIANMASGIYRPVEGYWNTRWIQYIESDKYLKKIILPLSSLTHNAYSLRFLPEKNEFISSQLPNDLRSEDWVLDNGQSFP